MSDELPPRLKPINRIVTGHNDAGLSTAIFVDEVKMEQMRPPAMTFQGRIWTTSQVPSNNDDQKSDAGLIVPARFGLAEPNGASTTVIDMPPGGKAPMHRTSTIDYVILVSGEVYAVLEDGTEKLMSTPGDILVQRGTLHRWENRSKDWSRFVCVMIDAKPVDIKDSEGKVKETLQEGFNIEH